MSDRVMASNSDTSGTSKQPTHAYKSDWMAHWTNRNNKTVEQDCMTSTLKDDDGSSKKCFLSGGPEMATSESTFVNGLRDVSESRRVGILEESLNENSGKVSAERSIQSFPMFSVSQGRDVTVDLKNDHVSVHHEELQKSNIDLTLNRHEFLQPSCFGQAYAKVETSSRECSLNHGGDMLSQKQLLKSYGFLEKNSLAILPSFQDEVGSCSKVMPSCSSRRPLAESLMYRQEEVYEEKFNANYLSNSVVHKRGTDNLLETMKIYTKVDSVQETLGDPSKYSQTTRHFLFAEKTSINLSKDVQMLRDPVSMKLKGKMFGEFLNLFPDLGVPRQQGSKLQPVGSSADGQGQARIDEAKSPGVCMKNESSAETDTLDMDNFQRNRLCGTTSSSSNMAVKGRQNPSTSHRVEIPDMNEEVSVVPDRGSSMDNERETSTSKTQSMNMDHLLPDTLQLARCKSSHHLDSEPSSRWVKRLRTSASEATGSGTKSLVIEEALPRKKVKDLYSRIKDPGSKNITLTHPWIQRWCQSTSESPTKAAPNVPCEPETSKGTMLDELEKKQFPSIAAMALMSKALSGFTPSDLRKQGSLIVWNTRDFR